MTRLRSRARERHAIRPFAAFSVAASSSMIQSPDRAHWLSPSRVGTVYTYGLPGIGPPGEAKPSVRSCLSNQGLSSWARVHTARE